MLKHLVKARLDQLSRRSWEVWTEAPCAVCMDIDHHQAGQDPCGVCCARSWGHALEAVPTDNAGPGSSFQQKKRWLQMDVRGLNTVANSLIVRGNEEN